MAFNAAYRSAWRDYYAERTAAELKADLLRLIEGMDEESAEICERQTEMMPHFFPDQILNVLKISSEGAEAMLTKPTARRLREVGVIGTKSGDALDAVKSRLSLPEAPLPELLSDSGLRFATTAFRQAVRGREVIDGGAYIGDTAHMFVQNYAARRVHAFEPEPGNFARMRKLVSDWNMEDRIRAVNKGLGSKPGEMRLWGTELGASTIRKSGFEEANARLIQITSIDSYCETEALDIGLIKLDVEGLEHDVLLGARSTIERCRPALVISIYHTAQDFFGIKPMLDSWDLGYKFEVRKLSADLCKELVLLCTPAS
ncbi:FkbM family methyltransferase [Palleronia sp.]|uniref:FkbM family methyltransferase n=1 Tax=Palleronia sp. TaxID=1940284 RepID=UPI0035C81EAA